MALSVHRSEAPAQVAPSSRLIVELAAQNRSPAIYTNSAYMGTDALVVYAPIIIAFTPRWPIKLTRYSRVRSPETSRFSRQRLIA